MQFTGQKEVLTSEFLPSVSPGEVALSVTTNECDKVTPASCAIQPVTQACTSVMKTAQAVTMQPYNYHSVYWSGCQNSKKMQTIAVKEDEKKSSFPASLLQHFDTSENSLPLIFFASVQKHANLRDLALIFNTQSCKRHSSSKRCNRLTFMCTTKSCHVTTSLAPRSHKFRTSE